MRQLWGFLRDTWCYWMHPDPMWPVNGQYRCPECHRLYPVPWESGATRWSYSHHSVQPATAQRLRPEYAAPVPCTAEVQPVHSMKRLLSA